MKKGRKRSIWTKLKLLIWEVKISLKAIVLRRWGRILGISYTVTGLILVLFIFRVGMDSWDNFGVVLTGLFGLISGISLIVSFTVLHSIREVILSYLQAGPSFEKIIEESSYNTFVLTENPAFLQAVVPRALDKWLNTLKDQLQKIHYNSILFAYVHREHLIAEKIRKKWAPAINRDPAEMSRELKSRYTFSLCKDANTCSKIFCVPMNTSSFPFYIAIADSDREAMFCNSKEVDPDVKKWNLKGFKTYDPYITAGLKEVFLKFLQLNAAVYKYECLDCRKDYIYLYHREKDEFIKLSTTITNPLQTYLFDHDLFRLDEIRVDISFDASHLDKTPQIPCRECKKMISPKLIDLREIDVFLKTQEELQKYAGVDLPENLIDKWQKDNKYNLGWALFWIVTYETWKD